MSRWLAVLAAALPATAGLPAGVLAPAAAQGLDAYCEERFDVGIGPTVVDASGWNRLAAKASFEACRTGHAQMARAAPGALDASPALPVVDCAPDVAGGRDGFPFSYTARAEGSYLLASSAVRIPDASTVSIGAGLSISISRPDCLAPDSLTPPEVAEWDGGGFDHGYFELGLTLGYASSADRTEQHLSLGGEARYGGAAVGWTRHLPHVVARYELVDPRRSIVRDTLGVARATDRHGRFSLLAHWDARLRFLSPALASWQLGADASLFRTRGLEDDLLALGWSRGEQAAVQLGYLPAIALFGPLELRSLYARWSTGALPTNPIERDAFSAGVTVGLR